jgi:hypothetical protein
MARASKTVMARLDYHNPLGRLNTWQQNRKRHRLPLKTGRMRRWVSQPTLDVSAGLVGYAKSTMTNPGSMTTAVPPVIRALDQTVPIEIYDHEFLSSSN